MASVPMVQPSRLHLAAERGKTSKIKQCILAGDDVNSRDQDGLTPLAIAVSAGEVGAVKLLLSSGTDLSIRDKEGMSPLDRAIDHADIWR